ncbi:hypothetical protein FHX42_001563 [Saccharopolyspora lacisalsi]|uniref:Uncharacterized protein n=1 Tax=Halosaccharopolyspora lacisalsi TaxID=1000566 RepID=A0A839DRU3_9PSEU|nr:hypothetical protein [Halosaccharopolyspora lacisalsi]MBA8824234.1 hypothetical protein [Halosaccharopolyspora lacisalsi]
MSIDRTDKLVGACFAATTAATVGMFSNYWPVVYYSIPVLVTLFMLMGSLDKRDEWNPPATAGIVSFGLVLVLLFGVANAALHDGGIIGGLPTSTAVFVYAIWPVATVVGPLVFAWVYHTWLRHDLEDTDAQPVAQ